MSSGAEFLKTTLRKDDHLDLCSNENVQSEGSAGWEAFKLPHCALPDIDWNNLNLETELLGKTFSAPIVISSMTGGSEKGEAINRELALFAQNFQVPMGVGSQRAALENRDANFFSLRKIAPRATLYANIGAVQLNCGVSTDDLKFLVDSLEADALFLHLNPLQEAIQLEGDRNFSGLWPKIEAVCKNIRVPVILKETGCGLDVATCKRAVEAGIHALDIAGFGGTHWGYIEGLRKDQRRALGVSFRSWGIPTLLALVDAREACPNIPIIASGGIRSGLDMAKAIFAGADFCGTALPFLKAAEGGQDQIENLYKEFCEAIKIALFCTNSMSISDLRTKGTTEKMRE